MRIRKKFIWVLELAVELGKKHLQWTGYVDAIKELQQLQSRMLKTDLRGNGAISANKKND